MAWQGKMFPCHSSKVIKVKGETMKLEKMVEELVKIEDRMDKVADSYSNRGVEGTAEKLYRLSERIRKARKEIDDIAYILDRQFPNTIPH